MPAYFIETYGCQMNAADSEYMASLLQAVGHHPVDGPEAADIILVNTCSIREKAERKVLSFAGRMKPLKSRRPRVLGICGCVARQEGERLVAAAPHIDLVFGPHHLNRLPEFIDRARAGEQVIEVSDRPDMHRDPLVNVRSGIRGLVPVMQGCDNFCTYCIVPHVRGREASRPSGDIVAEVRAMAASGVREVLLLGQNVNSYGRDGSAGARFSGLIEMIAQVPGIERIRFTTSHPKDLGDDLIALFGSCPALCPSMHLPVQSGSDRILAAMNRRYTASQYLGKVRALRAVRPDIAITTDIIVGFPGETDDDFEQTMAIVEELRYDGAFSFKFSPRPGTPAASMDGQVPEDLKQARLERLQDRLKEIIWENNRKLAGKTLPVLVESASTRDSSEFTGRTPCFRIVNFSIPEGMPAPVPGATVNVTISRGLKNSLRGSCAGPA